MRTEWYQKGALPVDRRYCRAVVGVGGILDEGFQCIEQPIFSSPMAMPEGQRKVSDDRLHLCVGHYDDYDGWPGSADDDVAAFSRYEPITMTLDDSGALIEVVDDGWNPHGWAAPFLARRAELETTVEEAGYNFDAVEHPIPNHESRLSGEKW